MYALSQNTRKVLLIICAGPMCLCIVYRGKNWVVSDVGTWSRRSYAIDCEYSSSSAPAPSTYKHSTYLRTVIRQYQSIASTEDIKLRVTRPDLSNWAFSSRVERLFWAMNLCRSYCNNLNHSINPFFQQNKFYCFILLTICLLKSSERSIFSVGK